MAEATSEHSGAVRANITTDRQGWFKAVSPQFLALIDQPVQALAGVNMVDLIHPHDAALIRGLLGEAEEGAPATSVVARLFVAGDRWFEFDVAVSDVTDARITLDLIDRLDVGAAPVAIPALPANVEDDLPYSDSPEHMAYVALMPGDTVPAQRVAIRERAGDAATPMIEIDAEGQTVFVSGTWSTLSTDGASGAGVFEELLDKSGQADLILAGMGGAVERAQPSRYEIAVPGLPPRWVHVVPIPSPHRAGVAHALIAVVAESGLGDAMPVAAPAPAPLSTTPTPTGAQPLVEAAPETAAVTDAPVETLASPAASRRWLAIAAAACLIVLLLVVRACAAGIAGTDGSATGPVIEPQPVSLEPVAVSVELIETEAVEVTAGQQWRAIGAEVVGEVHGIATTDQGAYVADTEGRMFQLDTDGAAVAVVGVGGGSSSFISDLVADQDTAWALDAGLGRIVRVDPDGTVMTLNTAPGPLNNARGMGAAPDGSLWVASTAAAQLTHVAPDGSILATISLPGRQPSDVVAVDDGFWIIDAQELELVQLSASGDVLNEITLDSFSSLDSPHLAIIGDRLWVTEPEMSAVFAIDLTTGEPSGEPSGDRIELTRPDDTSVTKPIGIASGTDGRLWLVDSQGGGIIILDP